MTDAERERLIKLSEECAKVIQIISKILLFGYDEVSVVNPVGPNNRRRLELELRDVCFWYNLMDISGDIDLDWIEDRIESKYDKAMQYSQFQVDSKWKNWVILGKIAYNKNLKLIACIEAYVTGLELHRELCNEFDKISSTEDELYITDPMITSRSTDHIFEVHNGWEIINLENLYECSIYQKGEWITPHTVEIIYEKNI